MIEHIFAILTGFIINVISSTGYVGVGLLMGIESAAIPLPSEIIMPFAGFLVAEGRFTLWGIAVAGGLGSVVGSLVTYYVGLYGGRPLLERYGKYLLISQRDLEISDRFFAKYGLMATFIGRMLPVFRTFISIPAGIARMPLVKFLIYSFIGSFIWSYALGYVGMKLGENWTQLRERVHGLDYIILGLIVIAAIWWVWRHFKHRSHS
jgi:membrane protein DedA with SNARE-associated domain